MYKACFDVMIQCHRNPIIHKKIIHRSMTNQAVLTEIGVENYKIVQVKRILSRSKRRKIRKAESMVLVLVLKNVIFKQKLEAWKCIINYLD